MNWHDLGPVLGPVAPTLGRLIGMGLPFPFGGQIGEAAGRAIAAALGVEATPEAVQAAVGATKNDVLIAQLHDAEETAKAQWQAVASEFHAQTEVGVAQVEAMSATQQAELISGAWYQRWWRPLAMYVWILSWPVQLGEILYHIASRDPQSIANLATVVNSLAIWNAGPAALAGVYSWNRTQEKMAQT